MNNCCYAQLFKHVTFSTRSYPTRRAKCDNSSQESQPKGRALRLRLRPSRTSVYLSTAARKSPLRKSALPSSLSCAARSRPRRRRSARSAASASSALINASAMQTNPMQTDAPAALDIREVLVHMLHAHQRRTIPHPLRQGCPTCCSRANRVLALGLAITNFLHF